jgi:hypothetical protein
MTFNTVASSLGSLASFLFRHETKFHFAVKPGGIVEQAKGNLNVFLLGISD